MKMLLRLRPVFSHTLRRYCNATKVKNSIKIGNEEYPMDKWTNITPRIVSKIGKNLHNQPHHPLNLIRQRIQNYFYGAYANTRGNPLFAVFDNLSPVVTVQQNFDSLLVPENHVSRSASDTYYVNHNQLLRAHTSAHQADLVKMGFDAFLAIGDVYRRDEIDASHYPVFHQIEGVKLFTEYEVFKTVRDPSGLRIFEEGKRVPEKQACHTLEAVKLVEHDLKKALLGMAHKLFGEDIEYRWVETYFPFTHPSWELEIMYQGKWLEVLGCGIMEQPLLAMAGAEDKIGWAFGLGLERLAMKLYDIPDIRLFWSEDSGFLSQFEGQPPDAPIKYKPISQFPQCTNDISFWLPEGATSSSAVSSDFYDLVRTVGGDLVEQVTLFDEFQHPKTKRRSHAYRVVYRHMEKTLTQEEVNEIHEEVAKMAIQEMGVEIR